LHSVADIDGNVLLISLGWSEAAER